MVQFLKKNGIFPYKKRCQKKVDCILRCRWFESLSYRFWGAIALLEQSRLGEDRVFRSTAKYCHFSRIYDKKYTQLRLKCAWRFFIEGTGWEWQKN